MGADAGAGAASGTARDPMDPTAVRTSTRLNGGSARASSANGDAAAARARRVLGRRVTEVDAAAGEAVGVNEQTAKAARDAATKRRRREEAELDERARADTAAPKRLSVAPLPHTPSGGKGQGTRRSSGTAQFPSGTEDDASVMTGSAAKEAAEQPHAMAAGADAQAGAMCACAPRPALRRAR